MVQCEEEVGTFAKGEGTLNAKPRCKDFVCVWFWPCALNPKTVVLGLFSFEVHGRLQIRVQGVGFRIQGPCFRGVP